MRRPGPRRPPAPAGDHAVGGIADGHELSRRHLGDAVATVGGEVRQVPDCTAAWHRWYPCGHRAKDACERRVWWIPPAPLPRQHTRPLGVPSGDERHLQAELLSCGLAGYRGSSSRTISPCPDRAYSEACIFSGRPRRKGSSCARYPAASGTWRWICDATRPLTCGGRLADGPRSGRCGLTMADGMGIGRQEIERMASTFEHEDPGTGIRRRRPPPRGTHENARSEHQTAHFVRFCAARSLREPAPPTGRPGC